MRLVTGWTLAVCCSLMIAFARPQSVGAADAQAAAGAVTEKQVGEWVDTVCAAASDETARTAAAEKLKEVPPASITGPLAKRIKDEATADRALDLAVARAVPGLFAAVKPAFDDTKREERATEIAAHSGDAAAARFLASRWQKAAEESDTLRWTQHALLNIYVDLAACEELMRVVADAKSARRGRASEIVQRQALAHTSDPEALQKEWRTLKQDHTRAAQSSSLAGENLFALGWQATADLRRAGANIVLDSGSLRLTKFPTKPANQESFTLRARVLVLAPGKVTVKLVAGGENTSCVVVLEGGKCTYETESAKSPVEVRDGEWMELVFARIQDKDDAGKQLQVANVTCNGKPLQGGPFTLPGTPDYFTVETAGRVAIAPPGFSWTK